MLRSIVLVFLCCPALVVGHGVCKSAPAASSSTDRVFIQRGTVTKRAELEVSTAASSSVSLAAAAGEFVAMTLFVIIGCGSAMGVAKTPGWVLQVSLSFGLAITSLAYAVGKYSGAQINCAVTFGLVLLGQLGVMQGLANLVAQLLGSVTGAFILSKMHSVETDKTKSLACNNIDTDAGYSVVHALAGEIVMTGLLMFTVLETAAWPAAGAPAASLAPIAIGLAVFLAHSILIPIDGCSINPTRSFGPAVVLSLTRGENATSSPTQSKALLSNDALLSAEVVREDHGIPWVKRLLADEKERHTYCDEMFKGADEDGSGSLDVDEAVALVKTICTKMHIKSPPEERVKELCQKCSKDHGANKDCVLSLKEFRSAFKVTLSSCLHEAERELAEEEAEKEQEISKQMENSLHDAQPVNQGKGVWTDMWVFWAGPLLGAAVAVGLHHCFKVHTIFAVTPGGAIAA